MGKSNKRKGEGQYAPLPYGLLKSEAWRSLSGPALKVFLELHTRFNGSNNGKLVLSYSEASYTLHMGRASVRRAFEDLVEKGFVVLEKEGNWYHRRAHEWRLTTKPMHRAKSKEPATNDWRSWRPKKTEHGTETDPSASSVVSFEYRKASHGST